MTTRGEPGLAPSGAAGGPSPGALEAELGPDLWTLVAPLGAPVIEAVPVTTIRWSGSPRASFRLTLADGRVLKGRRFRTPADVIRVSSLTPLLDPMHFPRVLTSHGCALLTPWIAGEPATPESWTPGRLRACGGVQGALHRVSVPSEVAALQPRTLPWTERLDWWLRELVAAGALDAPRARKIHRLVAGSAPVTNRPGVCHTDFCGDNIVITDGGRIAVVDNEGLSLDAPEFDLARTWYRWPLTPPQLRAYAEGYGTHPHTAGFEAHFLHWALLAVLDSAAYRTRAGTPTAQVPLDRLATLVRTEGRDESFPRILPRGGR